MNHPVRTQWLQYAADELAEAQREQLEEHMAACERCLLEYIAAVEQLEQLERQRLVWPVARAEAVTDEVMAAISGSGYNMDQSLRSMDVPFTEQSRPAAGGTQAAEPSGGAAGQEGTVRRRRQESGDGVRRRRLLHYAIAVCFMLLMMSAGIFDRLAEGPAHWKQERETKQHESLTESIMVRASGVIDTLVEKQQTESNR